MNLDVTPSPFPIYHLAITQYYRCTNASCDYGPSIEILVKYDQKTVSQLDSDECSATTRRKNYGTSLID